MAERSKEDLDNLFSPSCWGHRCIPQESVPLHIQIISETSERVKKSIPNRLDIQYGSSSQQKVDIFGEDILPSSALLFIYIHGGFWQELSRSISSYCVEPLVQAGCVVLIVGYDLAPQVTLDQIVQQVADAARFSLELAETRGSRGIVFCGHSAGAHLVATLGEWTSAHCEPQQAKLIKGFVLISGIYDLTQLRLSYVNDALRLTLQDAERLSPLACHPILPPVLAHLKTLIFVGEFESPEFQEQSEKLKESLCEQGFDVSLETVPQVDHFQIVERLQEKDFTVTQLILDWLRRDGLIQK